MANNRRSYIIAGILGIVIIYSIYYLCFVYVSYYDAMPRKVRHLSRFFSILAVYCIGYYTLKKIGVKWLSSLWNIIYVVVVTVLVLIGVFDWSFGPTSMQVRNIAKTLHEFLISPILYMALLIINRTLVKVSKGGKALAN